MNQELKDYIFFLFCQSMRVVFAGLGMAVLARSLGPEGMGRWALMIAAGTLFHVLFINWIQQDTFLRFGKEEWVRSSSVRDTWNARMPFILPGILISIIIVFFDPFGFLKKLYGLSTKELFLALGLFFSLILSIEFQTLFQITGKMKKMAFVPVVVSGISSFCYLGLWAWTHHENRLILSFICMVAITILSWGSFGLIDIPKAKLGWQKWKLSLTKEMFSYGWPLLPSAILGYLILWGNQIIIQTFLTTKDVGYYQTAFQIHSFIIMMAVPLTTILVPRLIAKNLEDPTIMPRFVTSIAPTIFFFWLLLMIPLIVALPATFIRVFGSEYRNSIPLLKILLWGTPLCALGHIYTGLFSVQKKTKWLLGINALNAFLNISIALLFLQVMGIQGVAYAYVISFVVSKLVMCIVQYRFLKASMFKLTILIFLTFLFSVSQIFFLSLASRVFWGAICLFLVIGISRIMNIVSQDTIIYLFTGRFEWFAKWAIKVLVPTNRRAELK